MANEQITIKNRIITLVVGALSIIFVLGSYSAIKFYVTRPEQPRIDPIISREEVEEAKKEAKKETPIDFEKYLSYKKVDLYPNGLVAPVDLVQSCEDRKRIAEKCNQEIAKITKTLSTSGNIENAYLYLRVGASRENTPFGILTNFDSVWFYVDGSESGGHLLRSRAIVKRQSEDGVTELLYDLREVPFVGLPYRDDASPRMRNILGDKLNIAGEHFIGSFVSTLGIGKIFEMKIGYSGGLIEIKE